MKAKFLLNFHIGLQALFDNKLRSFLTALGIIFGVAAVIAMISVGNGAKKEILDQIKLVGVNNIVITPLVKQEEEKTQDQKVKEKKYSPGLTLQDLKSILEVLPTAGKASPEIIMETSFTASGRTRSGKLIGVSNEYFILSDFTLSSGTFFNNENLENGEPVCIIGKHVQTKFFSNQKAIGNYIKCGNNWLKVIGVLEERVISEAAKNNLGIRDYNMDIYTPLKSMLIRYQNRGLVTKASFSTGGDDDEEESSSEEETKNYHQIDKIIIQIKETSQLKASADIVSRLLTRRHFGVIDFEITIPELLLKQQQKTKDIFNMVLGAIAGISLVVGGIGIMNIMLASVLERIKEIGIRLSLGATKTDIIQQFVIEAVLISLCGGIAGIIIGVVLSYLISAVAGIETIISGFSILISFGVSTLTGLIFGITPARRAAEQDPIKSLRHE